MVRGLIVVVSLLNCSALVVVVAHVVVVVVAHVVVVVVRDRT